MAPFDVPRQVLTSFKEKVDSLAVHDDRLYLGTATGSLHVYGFEASGGSEPQLNLVDVKKNLTRRSIEQVEFMKDINSLAALSEATVTLFPLPTFSPPTPLVKAKYAMSFATYSCTQRNGGDEPRKGGAEEPKKIMQPVPILVTLLLVGCRRRAVLYSWKDGEHQEVKEVPLPHSPRVIVFLDQDTACLAYSSNEYALFNLTTMAASEITLPPAPVTVSSTARGAFTGLSGYMSLGFGAKTKPCVVAMSGLEVLIVKDNQGIFVGKDGKPSRTTQIDWPAPPDETSFIKPYVLSALPAGSLSFLRVRQKASPAGENTPTGTNVTESYNTTTLIQIHSSLSLQVVHVLPFPFVDSTGSPISLANTAATPQNATVRLLTPFGHAKSRLFMVTTPTDRATAANEGSTVWQMNMKPWAEQLDELVLAGQYSNALSLLGVIDETSLPNKEQRVRQIRVFNAVSQFKASNYDAAIDTFTELDVNPAKVVALYPESVAGRLAVSADRWIPLFGGPEPPPRPKEEEDTSDSDSLQKGEGKGNGVAPLAPQGEEVKDESKQQAGPSFIPAFSLIRARLQESDTASITSQRKRIPDEFSRSVETLVRYLSDRRPKIGAALQAVRITPQNQSHETIPLSETPVEELFAFPDSPLSLLAPAQLLRFAQIVDTALYKSYLIIRPVLLGSLCRVPNWCEVTEVEEDLRARQKFAELKDLYYGKKMHGKALNLLRQLSEKEEDVEDKLLPTISYLQKLGPEHLDQIFKSARWVFEVNQDMAFEIFTSEEVELPRQAVADYLDSIDTKICARYLEFIIAERHEVMPNFHDRLAMIYLDTTLAARRQNDEKSQQDFYDKLLAFMDADQYYSVSHLFSILSTTDLHEARAILLGRLGRHDQALELYVYRLHDFHKAEEYSKRIYESGAETSNVFLTLLRLYLRPTVKTEMDLLHPALDLISRHSSRLDVTETLKLLPPLVMARDVSKFLVEALRVPLFDTRVVRDISKSRNDQVSRRLAALQTRRVKVTDSRMCPQCHKRLGNSVIAVHAPRGEVTHYQCREAFSQKLNEHRS